ncbi:MAG: CBS domain-containing protein [Proteobacteria bacterium]|nr:CBS domain-containing protein [Pseudomonadota bacterium]
MNNKTSEKTSWLKGLFKTFSPLPKTREQLTELLRDSQHLGLLDPDSLRMIEGVLQVSEMMVNEIMLPRSEIIVVPKDAPLKEILPIAIKSGHSRFPVIGENKDEVIGILLAKDLLNYSLDEDYEKFSIKEILRPVVFIPENKRLGILLNEFRKNRNHIAIVVDEYGGVTGLVSIEDVLEQIVGDIEDEHDVEKDVYIRKHKDNTFSVKAITPIEDFNQFFGTELLDDEFDTIGGLVLQGFGHLPKRGETITIEDIPFKVLRANNRRIQVLQTTLVIKKD